VGLSESRSTVTRFAPGAYDITCYDGRGAVAGCQRVSLGGGTTRVDCGVDQRPRVTVLRPGGGWRVSATESTPLGGGTAFAAMFLVAGPRGFPEVEATVVRESETEVELALSYAGRWQIEALEERGEVSWWRAIEVAPGSARTLTMPRETGPVGGLDADVRGRPGADYARDCGAAAADDCGGSGGVVGDGVSAGTGGADGRGAAPVHDGGASGGPVSPVSAPDWRTEDLPRRRREQDVYRAHCGLGRDSGDDRGGADDGAEGLR